LADFFLRFGMMKLLAKEVEKMAAASERREPQMRGD
jgi:hypothetical protein